MGTIFSGRFGLNTVSNRSPGMRGSLLIAWTMSAFPIGAGAAPVVSGHLDFTVPANSQNHPIFDFPTPANCPDCNEPLAMVAKFVIDEPTDAMEFDLVTTRPQNQYSAASFSTATANVSVMEAASGVPVAIVRARLSSDPAARGSRILVLSVRFDATYHGFQKGERWTLRAKSNGSLDHYSGFRVDGALAVAGDIAQAEALVTKPKALILPTGTVDFGEADLDATVPAFPQKSFETRNVGTAPLSQVSPPSLTPNSPFYFLKSKNSKAALPSGHFLIKVGFKPNTAGAWQSTLELSPNDGSPPTHIPLTGVGRKTGVCVRNCEVVRMDYVGSTLPCNPSEGPPLAEYCRDGDGDGHFSASDCRMACTELRPGGFVGAPAALHGLPPGGYVARAGRSADCNDSRGDIRPGAPELCTPQDENCDGDPYDGMPRAGTSSACNRCGFPGTSRVNSSCVAEACAIPATNNFASLPRLDDPVWGHGKGIWAGSAWVAETGGSADIVYGPYIQLPQGNYVVHYRGSHQTSTTRMWIKDHTAGIDVPGTSVERYNDGPIAHSIDADIGFHAEECHQYEFMVNARHRGLGWNYRVTVSSITLDRQ